MAQESIYITEQPYNDMGSKWTKEEHKILEDNYSKEGGPKGLSASGLLPGRTAYAINCRAKKLNVNVKYEQTMLFLDHDDVVYLAGIVDGEGHIGMTALKRENGKDWFTPRLNITNTDLRLMKWLQNKLGNKGLNVYIHKAKVVPRGWKQRYTFQVSGPASIYAVLMQIYPYLILKKEQAKLAMDFASTRLGLVKGTPYEEDYMPVYNRLRELNRKGMEVA